LVLVGLEVLEILLVLVDLFHLLHLEGLENRQTQYLLSHLAILLGLVDLENHLVLMVPSPQLFPLVPQILFLLELLKIL